MIKSRTHLPADERRAATVAAVVDLAARQNPNGITTAAIAKRMRLTEGALFRHFPTKDSIMQGVMSWVAERLLSRVDEAARNAPSPLAALEATFMAHVDFVSKNPGVPRIIFGQLQRSKDTASRRGVQNMLKRYLERLREMLEAGKASGELNADLDTGAAASLFIGVVQGLVMQSLLAGDVARTRRDAPRVFAIYCRGIGNAR